MGMFDEVIIDRIFCPFCGNAIENDKWQTKDTDCLLKIFNSLEQMYTEFYKIGYFDVVGACDNCDEQIRLQLKNKSKAHFEFTEREWIRMKLDMERWATETHPNHPKGSFDETRCIKCKKENETDSR